MSRDKRNRLQHPTGNTDAEASIITTNLVAREARQWTERIKLWS